MLEFLAGQRWASEVITSQSMSAAEAFALLQDSNHVAVYGDEVRDEMFRHGALELLRKTGLLDPPAD